MDFPIHWALFLEPLVTTFLQKLMSDASQVDLIRKTVMQTDPQLYVDSLRLLLEPFIPSEFLTQFSHNVMASAALQDALITCIDIIKVEGVSAQRLWNVCNVVWKKYKIDREDSTEVEDQQQSVCKCTGDCPYHC